MATSGPTSCGTGADDAAVGSVAWTNPGNITADDASYATAATTNVATSHWLKATNFGFTLPTDAIINGIQVTYKYKDSTGAGQVNSCKIVKGGTIVGSSLSGGESIPVSENTQSYGGSSNLWGQTWTAADINASNFGFVLQTISNAGGSTQSVNRVTATITYTPVAGGSSTQALLSLF